MKLSLNWIKKYVDLPQDLTMKKLAYDLTMCTVEVEDAVDLAESLGGTETLITYPTTQTHEDTPLDVKEKLGITDCFLRMSVGIENVDDIIADLDRAMNA